MGSFTRFVPRFAPFPCAPRLPEILDIQVVGLPLAVLGLYTEIFALPSHTMIARNSGHSIIWFSIGGFRTLPGDFCPKRALAFRRAKKIERQRPHL